jgi:Domain of unknown function (DUF4112)
VAKADDRSCARAVAITEKPSQTAGEGGRVGSASAGTDSAAQLSRICFQVRRDSDGPFDSNPGNQKTTRVESDCRSIPGFGDIAAALVSVSVLAYAVRRGVPKILLGRMALNVLINEVVGIVPIVGSIFAFWFTANTRNYELLRQHLDTPHRSTKSDKIFVGAILSLVIVVIVGGIVATFFIMCELAKLVSGA